MYKKSGLHTVYLLKMFLNVYLTSDRKYYLCSDVIQTAI